MNSIKQHLNNKSIVHLSMYIFGAYSAMNIATFFIGIGHAMAVGWFLGIALGIGLISASIYLSKQDYHDKLPFFLLLTAVILLAGLSGQIQYLAYLTHIETAPLSWFCTTVYCGIRVGVGRIVCGEIREDKDAKGQQSTNQGPSCFGDD